MYQTSGILNTAILKDSRTFRAKIMLENGITLSGAEVGTIETEHAVTDDQTLQIGAVLSRRAEIHLYTSRYIPQKGEVFRLFLYLLDRTGASAVRTTYADLRQWTHAELSMLTHEQIAQLGSVKDTDGSPLNGEFIPCGEFVVTRVRRQGCGAEITAYDKLQRSDALYVPQITFPADSGAVTDDVLRQLGIAGRVIPGDGSLYGAEKEQIIGADGEEILVGAEYAFLIPEAPQDMTCREVLGAVSAMYGGNGILDRNGSYTTVFFDTAARSMNSSRIDEPEYAEADIRVDGIRCTVDDETELTAGDPDGVHAVECVCPWMTQTRLNALWNDELKALRWRPAEVHERLGDPRHDLGDRLSVKGLKIQVTSVIYHFDGGLSTDITSAGDTEE